MSFNNQYIAARILIALMALFMAAATIPAYANPTFNPGLTELIGTALSLGETAAHFLVGN